MFSLISHRDFPSHSSPSLLAGDCIRHILQFTDKTTTSSMYLVCRSWYHMVDRFLYLSDKYMYVPEMYRRKALPGWCNSSSLPIYREHPCWKYVQFMFLNVDTLELVDLPPMIEDLHIDVDSKVKSSSGEVLNALCVHLSSSTSLETLDLSGVHVSDIRGLEAIPTLQTLFLDGTDVFDVSHLSVCRALQELALSKCNNLTDAGIRGLEHIPTLKELNLDK
eukprot:PhF_6_TR31505/c0_g1_i4/m.46393